MSEQENAVTTDGIVVELDNRNRVSLTKALAGAERYRYYFVAVDDAGVITLTPAEVVHVLRDVLIERDTALDVIARRLLINDEDKRYPFHDGDGGWWWMDNPDWDSTAQQATPAEANVLAAAETRHKDASGT